MFAVEIYAAVRRFVFVEGKSRREAARVFGLSRDTIAKMCRYSAPPGYVRSKAPERPKLGPLVPVIDAILEADKTAPPKQRHTAKRIFERLRIEHGFAGGYTVVKDYVRLVRTRSREVFIPLAHPPGLAQVDFGECVGVIGGVRMKLHVFCFDLPQSDACFIKAYPAACPRRAPKTVCRRHQCNSPPRRSDGRRFSCVLRHPPRTRLQNIRTNPPEAPDD
jgi:transposase